jgi:hypothetical protein
MNTLCRLLALLTVLSLFSCQFSSEDKAVTSNPVQGVRATNVIKTDNTICERNGFTVKVEKPLIKGDFIVFLFRVNNKSPYFAMGRGDNHLSWQICGMGKCESYDSFFFRSDATKTEAEALRKQGYEVGFVDEYFVRNLGGKQLQPNQETGLLVPISLKSDVVQGNKIKVSNFGIFGLYDEFGSLKEGYSLEAMFERNGNEISPISISLN